MEQALTADTDAYGKLLFMLCARMERLGISAEEALSLESDHMIECFLEMNHSGASDEIPNGGNTL